MENPTLKEFATDLLLMVAFSVVMAWVFMYAIPSIARIGFDEEAARRQHTANSYHQYLIRKGVVNE